MIFGFEQASSPYAKPVPLFPKTKQNFSKASSSIRSGVLYSRRELSSATAVRHCSSRPLEREFVHVDIWTLMMVYREFGCEIRLRILDQELMLPWHEQELEINMIIYVSRCLLVSTLLFISKQRLCQHFISFKNLILSGYKPEDSVSMRFITNYSMLKVE